MYFCTGFAAAAISRKWFTRQKNAANDKWYVTWYNS